MFENSGLSMDQAPPIVVVLRFFLTGSIFGIVASFMLFFYGESVTNFSSAQALALTHTLTLGVMASFMFGALYQMLPVLCGVAIKEPETLALRVNYALILGTIFLSISFFTANIILYILASLSLAYALFTTAYIMIKKLKTISHSSSSRGMLLSLISLVFVAILGLLLLSLRGGFNINIDYLAIKSAHFSFGLFGWIALLIISVSFQVIEMFYVTPPYNKKYANYLPQIIITLLFINLLSAIFAPSILNIVESIIILLVALHAGLTLIKLKQKKRAVTDATILFWAFGMSSYILFAFLYTVNIFITIPATIIVTLFAYFALSIVFAMSYKIVPFLVWFHLNAKGYFEVPMMHEIAHPKYARVNLYLFIASFVSLLLANFISIFWQISSLILFLVFFMLFYILYRAINRYFFILKNGKKFEFNIPNLG